MKLNFFGKSVSITLLSLLFVGVFVGCSDSGTDSPAVLQSIAITTPPTKTIYNQGEALNLTGLVVTGTYSDGMLVPITGFMSWNGETLINGSTEITAEVGTKTVRVTYGGKIASFTIAIYGNVVSDINDIADTLDDAADGDTEANPISLLMNVSLTDGGWDAILAAIASAGKYVALDLLDSTMDSSIFDPGTGAGADKVVSIGLPTMAQSIKSGADSSDSTFAAFTSLASISGTNVTSIGYNTFYGCTSLTTVSLPAATSIGYNAFRDCTSLTTVNLPAAASIGYNAFYGCTSLTTMSLPAATSIGYNAFRDCTSLTTVNLPAATSIGNDAFNNCANLTSVSLPFVETIGERAFADCAYLTSASLPVAASIGERAFYDCARLTTMSLPATPPTIGDDIFNGTGGSGVITITVPSGSVPNYTTAWAVAAQTDANTNTTVYGGNHKSVTITDAS